MSTASPHSIRLPSPSSKTKSKTDLPSSNAGQQNIIPTNGLEEGRARAQKDTIAPEPTWPSGWRPWAALVGSFFLMFNSWGLVNAYGTFSSYYKLHILPNRNDLEYNAIGSTQCFFVLSLSFVVGRLLDAGYSRYLIVAGGSLVTGGMFALSGCSKTGAYNSGDYGEIWTAQGFMVGLGMACLFVSSSQVAATWFKPRKSFAIGIVACGASIAGLVYPFMLKNLVNIVGFPNAVRCCAGVTGLTALISAVFAVPNPKHPVNRPERWLDTRVWFDTHSYRDISYRWFVASVAFLFLGFYAVFFNIEEWAAAQGFGKKDTRPDNHDEVLSTAIAPKALPTYILLGTMNASSTIGRLASAYLSDHFGAVNVHMIVTFISSLLILVLWIPTNLSPLTIGPSLTLAFVTTFGAFSGAVIGLPPASVASILGPHRQARLGQWTGMMYSVAALPALIGPLIAGSLISRFHNYYTVQAWAGTSLLLSSVCMLMSRLYRGHGAEITGDTDNNAPTIIPPSTTTTTASAASAAAAASSTSVHSPPTAIIASSSPAASTLPMDRRFSLSAAASTISWTTTTTSRVPSKSESTGSGLDDGPQDEKK